MTATSGISQPTVTAKAKRDALFRELRTGRKIPAYERVSLAGLQYNRAVHELRWNIRGCVCPNSPGGLEYGLNIQNDNQDPHYPDHTVFWLAPGCWKRPGLVGAKANRRIAQQASTAIDRDDALEARRLAPTPSFPQFGVISKESYGAD
jgi:hypothetical protein